MTKTFSFGFGTVLAIAVLVFLAVYAFAQTAHAEERRCTPTTSSSAWNGGNSAPGSHMYKLLNSSFLRISNQ